MTKSEIICHIGKHYWQDSYITHDEMLNMRKKDLEKYLHELEQKRPTPPKSNPKTGIGTYSRRYRYCNTTRIATAIQPLPQ